MKSSMLCSLSLQRYVHLVFKVTPLVNIINKHKSVTFISDLAHMFKFKCLKRAGQLSPGHAFVTLGTTVFKQFEYCTYAKSYPFTETVL